MQSDTIARDYANMGKTAIPRLKQPPPPSPPPRKPRKVQDDRVYVVHFELLHLPKLTASPTETELVRPVGSEVRVLKVSLP